MKPDPKAVLTGTHFIDGDFACAEGAIAAGCRFAAGYPITPSTEVVERLASRFPKIGGIFIQMEDEIASSIAIQGAVWGGQKAMTVTSGPGFSLMQEHIGLAVITETPVVFVDVQRGGPSTGLPTLPAQGDMMQARWGSHGDYEMIALVPNSCQEAFSLTIEAFNLAEQYRVPVMLMMDECVGHMYERVVIPPVDEINIVERTWTDEEPGKYQPYKVKEGEWVPKMAKTGRGYKFHISGLTHNEKGYPDMSWTGQEVLIKRIVNKIRLNADKIVKYEESNVDNADVVVVSYGITSRVATNAIDKARKEGIKVGHLRLITAWPFPGNKIAELSKKIAGFVVPELNLGQMYYEVERYTKGNCKTLLVPHAGGTVHNPDDIYASIKEVAHARGN